MAKPEKPTPAPVDPPRTPFPRPAVVLVSAAVTGGMIYLGSRDNYVGTICCALVLLSILGADVGALLKAWRGGPS